MEAKKRIGTIQMAILGGVIVLIILVLGTLWMGRSAKQGTQDAAHTVSVLYLDELAGRREQVVESNLQNKIKDLQTAVGLMTEPDLSSMENLQAYQARMRKLYTVEKFAFVDSNGLIYTADGTKDNIGDYSFDYQSLSEPEISVLNLEIPEKKAVLAAPVDISFNGQHLVTCFMEIDMNTLLAGVSMESGEDDATFCNIYTRDGIALSNTVLGGLAVEDNLLDAMKNAHFEDGYSYESFIRDFEEGTRGEVSFTYNGIQETLSYVPVAGTDWLLTYLVRESVIGEQISSISDGIILRSIIQSILTVLVLFAIFAFIISQIRKNNQLALEKEAADAENRAKQEELDQRLALQEQLIEQQKALAEALAAAEEASKAKTVFLSNMSHEIRTPMNAIIGLDNIALNDPETPEKTREYLEKIGASADHLLNLINDILDMSRIESGRMILKNEEFSFPKFLEAINTMFSSQASEKGLDYQCHINGEVDDYYIGDNMKLRQVLVNILGNAIKFTPEGGRVGLEIERKTQFGGKTTLQFTVSDTGIGMSEEYLPHIFDAFSQEESTTTSKYGNTGLGMAITRSIVEMMNGDIQVASVKGEGSTFTVTVTLGDSERRDSGAGEDEILPNEMSVLIVDDDPVACEHAKLVLEKIGIAAEIAVSGAEAIEMVELRHARRNPYNLILVDWQMPEMDGVETSRQIRSIIGNESAIIILTAYRWDDVLEEATEAGVDSFIAKPLFAGTVLEEFRSAIERKGIAIGTQKHKADLTGRRILVAEDVQINAEIMVMVLQTREMECELAENGRIALEMFQEHEPGYYDAVLMDMRMPEMDGLEATQAIRALDREDAKSIPIIALTANAFDEDVQRSLQAGLNAHLSKPVQPEMLYETLEGLIED